MKTVRQLLLWLLFLCLVCVVSWPTGKVAAEDPFAFTSLTYPERDGQIVTITPGMQVYRGLNQLTVNFNHPLNPQTIQHISLQDSTGTVVPLQNPTVTGTGQTAITVTLTPPLPKNQTYVFLINGGVSGVLDSQNNALPSTINIPFQADDTPYINTITLNGYQKANGPDVNVYHFQAAQGPFTLKLNQMGLGNMLKMVIQNAADGTVITDQTLVQTQTGNTPTATYSLPNTGEYKLVLIPKYAPGQTTHAQSMTISANELQLPDPYCPPVSLRPMQMYETMSQPFSVQPALQNNAQSKYLKLMLNGKVLASNLLQNNTVQDYTIDPSQLTDGVYTLDLWGESPTSTNLGLSVRFFYVDHANSYADVPQAHWAHKPIEVLSHLQILHGTDPGRYEPSRAVTRAEFAAMMVGALHLPLDATSNISFADDPHDWSSKYINAMAASGLVQGVNAGGQTYFYPSATISRQDAAAIIGRALGISQKDIAQLPVPFPDFTQVKPYAQPSVLLLNQQKWISGYALQGQAVQFHPEATLNRDQAAKILSKFVGL